MEKKEKTIVLRNKIFKEFDCEIKDVEEAKYDESYKNGIKEGFRLAKILVNKILGLF